MRPLILAQGFECSMIWGESDEDVFPEAAVEDGGDSYFKALGDWQPKHDGDGWLITAVVGTEDGPCAWMVPPLSNDARHANATDLPPAVAHV